MLFLSWSTLTNDIMICLLSKRCYFLSFLTIAESYLIYWMILTEGKIIPGLLYIKNFISGQERDRIVEVVRNNPWCQHLRRKQQYYGIKYFQTKVADYVLQPQLSQDHLPLQLLQFVIDKTVQQHGFFEKDHPPNQILVNQYLMSDRLGLHIEDRTAFGDVIVGISIGSKEYLRLDSIEDPSVEYKLELEDSSCYVLAGQARDKWRHGIGRVVAGQRYKDKHFQRISLTVRHVIDSRRRVESADCNYKDSKKTE